MAQPAQMEDSPPPGWSSDCASSHLVALALLKANWNQQRSYLDNFVPFVAECLRGLHGRVQVDDIQRALVEVFRMELPLGALTTIMRRLVRKGWVDLVETGVYYPIHEELAGCVSSPERADLLRRYDALVERLVTFVQQQYGRVVTLILGGSPEQGLGLTLIV